MPKEPSSLYNHSTRRATARQLNLSTDGSGCTSLSYTSSQAPVEPPIPAPQSQHDYYIPDANMDIDDIDEGHAAHTPDAMDEDEDETIEVMSGVHVIPTKKAKRYENSVRIIIFPVLSCLFHIPQDVPLGTWAKHRDEYLDECMALEGRGAFYTSCSGCRVPMPRYRCKDCMVGPLWCKSCLVERHDQSPLHIVEVCYLVFLSLFGSHWESCFLDVERSVFPAHDITGSRPSSATRTRIWSCLPH
jgi:hypothetical protein